MQHGYPTTEPGFSSCPRLGTNAGLWLHADRFVVSVDKHDPRLAGVRAWASSIVAYAIRITRIPGCKCAAAPS